MCSPVFLHYFLLVLQESANIYNLFFLSYPHHSLPSILYSMYSWFSQLAELTDIPAENIVFAKGKGTFPCDMSVLDIPNELDWSPRTGQLDQRPLYIMDDGAMIYFRWEWRERSSEKGDDTMLVENVSKLQRVMAVMMGCLRGESWKWMLVRRVQVIDFAAEVGQKPQQR